MEMQQTLQGNEGMLFDGFMVILLGVILLAGMRRMKESLDGLSNAAGGLEPPDITSEPDRRNAP